MCALNDSHDLDSSLAMSTKAGQIYRARDKFAPAAPQAPPSQLTQDEPEPNGGMIDCLMDFSEGWGFDTVQIIND